MPRADEPLVTFYQVLRGGGGGHLPSPRSPHRAPSSAAGTLPADAFRYCEPARAASAFGYHLYPPMSIGLRFDGAEIEWSMDGDGTGIGASWFPLSDSVFYPGFAAFWASIAPEALKNMPPPLLAPTNTRGVVQVWGGSFARTLPNWSLLVRSPVNDSRRSLHYEVLEGIIETDWWGGPLFANIQLLESGKYISLAANRPFMQVVPVHSDYYGGLLNEYCVTEYIPEEIFTGYGTIVLGNKDGSRPVGQYAVDVRRRRAEGCRRGYLRAGAVSVISDGVDGRQRLSATSGQAGQPNE